MKHRNIVRIKSIANTPWFYVLPWVFFRLYMDYGMNEGDIFPGAQVARVVESRNSAYSKGKVLLSF